MIDGYNNDQVIKLVSYTDADIDLAKSFTRSTLKTIVYPVSTIEELDRLFNEYLSMTKHGKFESDEACRRIFKCSNRDLYEIIKAQLLKNTADPTPSILEPDTTLPEQCLFSESVINPLDYALLEAYKPKNFSENVAKKEVLLNIVESGIPIPAVEYPYFTSKEISMNLESSIEDKVTYGDTFSYKEWYEGLQAAEKGIILESFTNQIPQWISEVRIAYDRYNSGIDKAISEKKLLELGCDPLRAFTEENRVYATNRYNRIIHEDMRFQIVDLSADLLENTGINEVVSKDNILYPIYIVLVEGKTLFSDMTKKITKGPFSHAAVGLDESLSTLYSFNMTPEASGGNRAGGFSIEDIRKYPQDNHLGVFAIFVKPEEYTKIKDTLNYYIANQKKTMYSILNVIALPFNAVIKMDMSMICSEFVDNLLKICNINIVDKASPLVTPNDFYRASASNSKIYKIYEGIVNKYKTAMAKRKISRLVSSRKYIKEACLLELKEFPIQFSNEGDLLIANMRKLNYEDEYNKTHRLLLAYNKSNNIEGIKYELAKLWFLNQLLEKDIYTNRNSIANSNCRSRVLNDFNKYLDVVLKSEPEFNFTQYYSNTPFSDTVIKIKGSTVKYTIDYVKQALKPTV